MFPQPLRTRNQRGFYLIGLLIVLAILGILYGKQLLPTKEGPGMVDYIDRSKGAACSLNRSTLVTNIGAWNINHPGEAPTIEKLRAANVSVPTCGEGGTYVIGRDGAVYCSKHLPVPADQVPAPGTETPPAPPEPLTRTIVTPPPTPDIPAE